MTSRSRTGTEWAGLVAGPAAWASSTQLNYALASWSCTEPSLVPLLALGFALFASAGAAMSWFSWRRRARDGVSSLADGEPRQFAAVMSALLGILFAIIILIQGAAGLILTGCER